VRASPVVQHRNSFKLAVGGNEGHPIETGILLKDA
jgi:hypothetical protein